MIEKFNSKENGHPVLSQASLFYAERDSKDPTVIHTYAPPFPNVYETGAICLGDYDVDKHPLTFNTNEAFKQTDKLLEGGWNQDLYRHFPLYRGPSDDNRFVGKIFKDLHKHKEHNFFRTTDQTEIKVITYLANKNNLIK